MGAAGFGDGIFGFVLANGVYGAPGYIWVRETGFDR